jgi:hypothetical protein
MSKAPKALLLGGAGNGYKPAFSRPLQEWLGLPVLEHGIERLVREEFRRISS